MADKEKGKTVTVLVDTGVAVVAGVTAATVTHDPAAGVVVAGGIQAGVKLVAGAYEYFASGRRNRLFTSMLEEEGRSAEEVAAEVAARMNDPGVACAVARAVRAALENPDEAAIAPLAALAKLYIGEAAVPARFFRGAAEILERVTAREIAELRRLLEGASSERFEHANSVLLGSVHHPVRGIEITGLIETGGGSKQRGFLAMVISDPDRLVHLLSTHGLARRVHVDGGEGAEMDCGAVVQFARVLAAGSGVVPT